MSTRALDDALAHADNIRGSGDDHCRMCDAPADEGERMHAKRYEEQYRSHVDLVLLAAEVARLRAESHQLRMIAIDITPYIHLETCEKCGQQKMCVGGFENDGDQKLASFFRCEDCSREIKCKYEKSLK